MVIELNYNILTGEILHSESKVKSLSRVRLFVTPWTVAYQAPLSVHGIFQARVLEWVAIFLLHYIVVLHTYLGKEILSGLELIVEA